MRNIALDYSHQNSSYWYFLLCLETLRISTNISESQNNTHSNYEDKVKVIVISQNVKSATATNVFKSTDKP